MLGLGDCAGRGEGRGVGGGDGGMNENHVIDGLKDNDVISISQTFSLLWPISIACGAFEQKGGTKTKAGGEGDELELPHGWLERK